MAEPALGLTRARGLCIRHWFAYANSGNIYFESRSQAREQNGSSQSPSAHHVMSAMTSNIWQLDRSWRITTPNGGTVYETTLGLAKYRSLVLLGAAGAGKTVELERLADHERAAGLDVRRRRLAEFAGSADELRRDLDGLVDGAAEGTAIYLDALDEALIPLKRAGLVVKGWIEEAVAGSGARLRITCRSAVWPEQLTEAMLGLVEESRFAKASLQPLTDSDVATAVNAAGMDSGLFLDAVRSRRVEALTRQPLTLKMLLRLFGESQNLPSRLSDLFQQGMLELAVDRHERFDIGTHQPFEPTALLDAAERLACLAVLSGRDTIDLGDDPPSDQLGWRELNALDRDEPKLDRDMLRAIGSSGLCDSASPRSFRFGHRQFAEYLAGRRFAKLLPHQAKGLLASPAGREAGVAGPLRETAAFAAMHNSELATWIVRHDPELVGLSDVADRRLRREAMLGLIEQCRQGKLTDVQVGRGEIELRGFQYESVEADLRPVLDERGDGCEDVLECAVALISSWRLDSMSDDLANLVLDATAPHHPRVAAGYALADFGSSQACKRLKPLIDGAEGAENDQLKGLALRCNWPDRLTVSELLQHWRCGILRVSMAPTRASSLIWIKVHFVPAAIWPRGCDGHEAISGGLVTSI